MSKGKVLVTGGCGFIGSNISRELLDSDYQVVVVDDLSTGKRENIEGLEDHDDFGFVQGDINDAKLLERILGDVDYILHQAAIPSVPRSVRDPVRSNMANVDGTLNVLNVAKDHHVKKVVYASSSSVYGDTPTLPKVEDMKPNPKSPYAVSKLTGEYYCRVFSDVYGLRTACLRYFNVFGPRQDPKSQYAAVIPKFITSILNDESPIIYGDGEQTRDFTFVKDVVKANILAMESENEGVFNISRGERITINQLVAMINDILGKNVVAINDDPRPGDIKHSLSDISLAREKIGYSPDHTLVRGLEETVDWYRKR